MAWVTRLLLQGDAKCPASVIAKFPSPVESNRAVANHFDMYGREVRFYQGIAAEVGVRTPACYHAQVDAENEFVLLLEDLSDMRIGDQIESCDLADAKMVIDSIAKLHASAWQPTQFPNLISHNNPAQVDGMIGGFEGGWPVVLKQFGDLIPEAVRGVGELMPKAVAGLLADMCMDPVCLSHADVRLDNVFFSPGGVALVDWQSICTSAPEQDLAYFLTQSLTAAVRAEEDLVAYYHAALTGAGVQYDLAQCRERYVISALYLLCYAVTIAGTLDLGNERGQVLGRTIIGNTFSALAEIDAFAVLEARVAA